MKKDGRVKGQAVQTKQFIFKNADVASSVGSTQNPLTWISMPSAQTPVQVQSSDFMTVQQESAVLFRIWS